MKTLSFCAWLDHERRAHMVRNKPSLLWNGTRKKADFAKLRSALQGEHCCIPISLRFSIVPAPCLNGSTTEDRDSGAEEGALLGREISAAGQGVIPKG